MKTESTYWDHSQRWHWDWFFQMLFNKNVYFFYDFKKRCFVRKVTHVKGTMKVDPDNFRVMFYPDTNKIIKYPQWL